MGRVADKLIKAKSGSAALPATVGITGPTTKLTTIDISDPTSMSILDTDTAGLESGVFNAAVDGNQVYTAAQNSDSVNSYDLSNPSAISHSDTLTDNTNLNGAYGIAIDADRDLLFVSAHSSYRYRHVKLNQHI